MKIKGFIKNSFLDWDGKIAGIIFTGGCNFRCPFCHNKNLLIDIDNVADIDESFVLDYLAKHKKWIDGIVISGGEPTLQMDLLDFLKKLKSSNILVKLDTNGYNPEILKKIVDSNLADYVAMDIKTALDSKKYALATGFESDDLDDSTKLQSTKSLKDPKNFDLSKVERSINLLLDIGFDCEFRTTLCPAFVGIDELLNIADKLKNQKWAWQNFRHSENIVDEKMNEIEPYTIKQIDEFEKIVKAKFSELKIIRR